MRELVGAAGRSAGVRAHRRRNRARLRFNLCGATHGQYLLDDVLADPPDCKLLFIAYARDWTPERRARLAEIQRMRPGMHVFEAMTSDDVAMESIEKHAKAAGVHFYTRPMAATVCAAEGFLVVQARQEGPLEIDFGEDGPVSDALTGRPIGTGPRISVPFLLGETRIFRFAPA